MRQNMAITRGLIFSQAVLLALTAAGMTRENAYKVVQRNAMRTWAGEGEFLELLSVDDQVTGTLTPDALEACFDSKRFLEHVDTIFDRVLGDS
jgi:adenylosuccinate lyase